MNSMQQTSLHWYRLLSVPKPLALNWILPLCTPLQHAANVQEQRPC